MKIKDQPQNEIRQWFLDFISNDLDKMSELEFSKRILESKLYFLFTEDRCSKNCSEPLLSEVKGCRTKVGEKLTRITPGKKTLKLFKRS